MSRVAGTRRPAAAWPPPRALVVALLALGLLAAVEVGVATAGGAGLTADSAYYVGGARQIVAGEGYTAPFNTVDPERITQFPPLYSLALATGDAAGYDILRWARLLSAAALALTVVLSGAFVLERTGGPMRAFAAGAAVALWPQLVWVFLHVWSEALFLPLAIGSVWLLAEELERPSQATLGGAAGLAALGCLTRYAGISLLVFGVVALLFLSDAPAEWRRRRALAYGTIAGLPLALWLLWNALAGGSAAGRSVGAAGLGIGELRAAARTLATWVIPVDLPRTPAELLGLLVAAACIAGLVLALRTPGRAPRTAALLLIFALSYAAVVLVALATLDVAVPIRLDGSHGRILAPAQLAVVLAAVIAAGELRRGRVLALAAGAALAALAAGTGASAVLRYHHDGIDFAGRRWLCSPLVLRIESLSAKGSLYTNDPPPVYLITGRHPLALPARVGGRELAPVGGYAAALDGVRRRLARFGGYVAFFTSGLHDTAGPLPVLQQQLGYRRVATLADGAVLAPPGAPPRPVPDPSESHGCGTPHSAK